MPRPGNAPEEGSLLARQLQFAAHIRDPGRVPRPHDVDARRMRVYCELFYNNIESLLATTFPVLHEVTEERRWHATVRDFFARHRARTPCFHELAREFLSYLEQERIPEPDDPPFLLELAHYEWVELELGLAETEVAFGTADAVGDLSQARLAVSPLVRNLSYRFPVHRISADWLPRSVDPTHLLVYRDRRDAIGFIELNAVSARLVQLIEAHPGRTGQAALQQVAAELAHPEPQQVMQAGLEVLRDLGRRDVLTVNWSD